jgi:hypothetical protein
MFFGQFKNRIIMKRKILYWFPRLFTIAAIIFMLMFSFDSFGGDAPLSKKVLGFLVHNVPVMILTVILIVAWKNELAGGLLFIAAFIAGTIFFRSFSGNPGSLVVIVPFLITGIMFILYHLLYGKKTLN